MNIVKKMHDKQDAAWQKLQDSGYKFDHEITFDQISVATVDDLLALEIGESTYVDCDVKRIA